MVTLTGTMKLLDSMGMLDKPDYGWKVTRDFWSEEHPEDKSQVGTTGPSWLSDAMQEKLDNVTDCIRWRVYDDDWNCYLEGIMTGDYTGFEPVDDFGTAMYGAIHIKHFENGKWEVL